MDYIKILLSIFAAIYATQSKGSELGNFRLTDYHVEVDAVGGNDSNSASGFHLGKSYFSLQWDKEKKLGGLIQVSGDSLTQTPRWYGTTFTHDSIFSKIYAFYIVNESSHLKMGLQEVPFGLESYLGVGLRELPDSLFLSNRYIVYSDIGLSFTSENNGLKTVMLAHNGLGVSRSDVKQNDDKFFYTARISKESESGELLGFSAQFGEYVVDGESINHKLTLYNLFGLYRLFGGFISLDLNFGTDKASSTDTKFNSSFVEYRYPVTRSFSVAVRANDLEPNSDVENDKLSKGTLAFLWNDRNANSRLGLILTETTKESGQKDSALVLNWKLGSKYNKRY